MYINDINFVTVGRVHLKILAAETQPYLLVAGSIEWRNQPIIFSLLTRSADLEPIINKKNLAECLVDFEFIKVIWLRNQYLKWLHLQKMRSQLLMLIWNKFYKKQKKWRKIALKIWFSEVDKNGLGSNSLPYWSVQLMNPVSKSLLIDFLW